MKAEIVHVTNHALTRWRERTTGIDNLSVPEIVDMVKKSKQLKKDDFLPYPIARCKNSVYSVYDNILFVLEPVTVSEYRLVTVISEPPPRKKENKEVNLNENVKFRTLKECLQSERNDLLKQKRDIEVQLSLLPKSKKKLLLTELQIIEARLAENKEWENS